METVPSVNPLRRPSRPDAPGRLGAHRDGTYLDTVFPPEEEVRNHFEWQLEGDRIYGPGIDIKGGTAMIWLVLHAAGAGARGFEE